MSIYLTKKVFKNGIFWFLIAFSLNVLFVDIAISANAVMSEKLPDTVKNAYQRAIWAAKLGKLDNAIALFNNITKDYPDISNAFTNLGLLHLQLNELSAAEKALENAISLNPADEISLNHLGVVYRKLGKFNKAENAYLQSLAINNQYVDAILNLGILYDLYMHNLENALARYRQYQVKMDQEDELVAKWIIDLERRIKRQSKQQSVVAVTN